MDFSKEIGKAVESLENLGHEVLFPATTEKILKDLVSLDDVKSEKEAGRGSERAIKNNAIMNHYKKIVSSDAILVLNYTKKETQGYIGGSTFMEMGFAFVNNKKIFLWDIIPGMLYRDELEAMQPILINKDLEKIK